MDDLDNAIILYRENKEKGLVPTFSSMNHILDCSMKLRNNDMIFDTLCDFKENSKKLFRGLFISFFIF